jgi:hypothetical protein
MLAPGDGYIYIENDRSGSGSRDVAKFKLSDSSWTTFGNTAIYGSGLAIDASNGFLYYFHNWSGQTMSIYNSSDGTLLDTHDFGTDFSTTWGIQRYFDYYNGNLYILLNTGINGTEQSLKAFTATAPITKKITLDSSLNGFLVNNPAVDIETTGSAGTKALLLKFTNDHPLAEIDGDFSDDRSWTTILSGESPTTGKVFIHNLIGQTGAGATYTLYIPIPAGKLSEQVGICPGASTLEDVTATCTDIEIKTVNDVGVSKVTINSVVYWKVSGLTGTGGISLISSYQISDTMTRLKAGVASNHLIDLGTVNGLLLETDSFVVNFHSNWVFGALSVSDIDLLDDGTNVDLVDAPAITDTWGVDIDNVNGTITFTAPASGSTAGYIAADSLLQLKIGTNADHGTTGTVQITNPASSNSYQVDLLITNAIGSENGNFTVPIVDSDIVDINGYISAYIFFDIDTGTGELWPGEDPAIECNYAAANACLTHSNGVAGANYTVDLGEMTSTGINKSQANALHSDGSGLINSIYFDLTTNSPSGAVVTVKSLNGGLQGPGTNKIPSIGVSVGADGITRLEGGLIPVNSGVYGYNLPVMPHSLNGAVVRNSNCNTTVNYCGASNIENVVFSTNSLPVDTARVRMDLAASANYTNSPGTYTDTLTFVATATF